MIDFDLFIKESIAANPVEAKIVRKIVKALKNNGTPVVEIDDGEELVPVNGIKEVLDVVFNLDECYLYTEGGSWVRIVLGNEWDCLVDYTLDIEDALRPVNEYIEAHM
jgi:hypothetical protein